MLRAIIMTILDMLSYLLYPLTLLKRKKQKKSLPKIHAKLREELLTSYKSRHKKITKKTSLLKIEGALC